MSLPLGHWVMSRWLEGFAYRTELGMTVFASAAGVVMLAAAVAIGQQLVQAAASNPVEALRSE